MQTPASSGIILIHSYFMNLTTHTRKNFSAFDSDAFRKRAEEQKNTFLLNAFERIEFADLSHPTSEMMDAFVAGNLKAAQILLKNGADIHARNRYGHTTLHSAAESGNLELVKWLVDYDVDVKAKANKEEPIWHYAADVGWHQLLEYFAGCGVDVAEVPVVSRPSSQPSSSSDNKSELPP